MTATDASVTFWEVIAAPRDEPNRRFGLVFTSHETAAAYADALRADGFEVDPFPEFETVATVADALAITRDFYATKGNPYADADAYGQWAN